MFNLTDILQFIVYRFNNGSLAKHYPVLQRKFSSFNELSIESGWRLSALPRVMTKLIISPLSLMIMCNLKPKNQPKVVLLSVAIPSNTRLEYSRLMWHTCHAVESMKLIPVQFPIRQVSETRPKEEPSFVEIPQTVYKKQDTGTLLSNAAWHKTRKSVSGCAFRLSEKRSVWSSLHCRIACSVIPLFFVFGLFQSIFFESYFKFFRKFVA